MEGRLGIIPVLPVSGGHNIFPSFPPLFIFSCRFIRSITIPLTFSFSPILKHAFLTPATRSDGLVSSHCLITDGDNVLISAGFSWKFSLLFSLLISSLI